VSDFEIFLAVAGGGVLLIGLARLINPDRFIDESWNFHRPGGFRGVLATVIGADLMLAAVHARGEGVGGSEQTYWVPSRWRQGECFWWGVFLDEQEALEAAGLRE
jgi:hypothetical protein